MVPAGFGQNCKGTWRMKTQRELKSYTFRFFWSMASLEAKLRLCLWLFKGMDLMPAVAGDGLRSFPVRALPWFAKNHHVPFCET